MATTKAQTGLSIARNDNKFTFTWKLKETYDFQQYRMRTSNQKAPARTDIGAKVTTNAFSVNKSNFYPFTNTKISWVAFYVRAKRKGKSWSAEQSKRFAIQVPDMPSLSASPSDSLGNVCTFSWNTAVSLNNGKVFTNVEFQSILVANSTETDGSKLPWKTTTAGWRTGTGNAQGNLAITETNASIASGSHTRWFRVRSRGPAGASNWRYSKRVYAQPNAPTIKSIQSKRVGSGWQELVSWASPANAAYPVEKNVLQYVVTIPGAGVTVPDGATWTDALTVNRTGTDNSGTIVYGATIPDDNVLFCRVNAVHVLSTTPSIGEIAQVGNLAAPTLNNVSTEESTYRATIQATNNSRVPGSFLVVLYRTASKPDETSILGIIPNGQNSVTVQCPSWAGETGVAFGVYAAVGSYTIQQRADGVSSAAVQEMMRSLGEIWGGGTVPQAPENVTVTPTGQAGAVLVEWNSPWREATSAILSWSDHEDAWMSTIEPSEYEVSNINAAQWIISSLDTGKQWYFKVRLKRETADGVVLGPWSETVVVDLASAPMVPALTLSNSIITEDGSVTAYWAYSTTDGTAQAYAEICEATIINGEITYGDVIATTETAQHITIYPKDVDWETGETHYLCVSVVSKSGKRSASWSDPVPVSIAEPIYAVFEETSLVEETAEERTFIALKQMPLTATITGAGAGGTTTLIIERADDYHVDRPDETSFYGFEGETIANFIQTGEDQITITRDDLIGHLDDGARYRLIGIVQDGLGQSDQEIIEFEVNWQDQAIQPEGEVYIKDNIAVITPIAPQGASNTATCDIYRLSADKPELIVQGGTFGQKYVDPYPTIGEYGGHRIVYLTADGDYITEENTLAWLDLTKEDGDFLDLMVSLIDFNGETIEMFYDTQQTNKWNKDFTETKYLGGSIQGDWNKGVARSSSFDVDYVTLEDEESIRAMRRLAMYEGLCHIRTLDGTSYDCDIQVNESRNFGKDRLKAAFSMSITKVNSESLNGQTYDNFFNEE